MMLSSDNSKRLRVYLRHLKGLVPSCESEKQFMAMFMNSSPDSFSDLRTIDLLRLIVRARRYLIEKGQAPDPPPDILHEFPGTATDILGGAGTWDSFRPQIEEAPIDPPTEEKPFSPDAVQEARDALLAYFNSLGDTTGIRPEMPSEAEFLRNIIKAAAHVLRKPISVCVRECFPEIPHDVAQSLALPIDKLRTIGYSAVHGASDPTPQLIQDDF